MTLAVDWAENLNTNKQTYILPTYTVNPWSNAAVAIFTELKHFRIETF